MPDPIRVDIVSDVVCPWCIVGFLQLRAACAQAGFTIEVFWHPFELNPQMPPEGQNLRAHITEKYGTTAEQSDRSRDQLRALGQSLGFAFKFSDTTRMHNTFLAHQLIMEAGQHGKAHAMKMALFAAHFSVNQEIADTAVLADLAEGVGLDRATVLRVLQDGTHAKAVRAEQAFWTSKGISGVPAMIFDQKYLVTGAQGIENYVQILQQVETARAA